MGTESYLPKIFIIFLAGIFLVLLLGKAGYVSEGTQKYIDNIINTYFGGQTTNVIDVSGEFQNIVSQYKNCFDSLNDPDEGCYCNIHLLTFSPGYVLSFTYPNNIVISKEETNIPKNNNIFTGKNIFCYITYDNRKINAIELDKLTNTKEVDIILSESPFKLSYETGETKIKLGSRISNIVEPVRERIRLDFLSNDKIAYKQGNNICFILKDELSEEGKAFINTLLPCSPKPLNS